MRSVAAHGLCPFPAARPQHGHPCRAGGTADTRLGTAVRTASPRPRRLRDDAAPPPPDGDIYAGHRPFSSVTRDRAWRFTASSPGSTRV